MNADIASKQRNQVVSDSATKNKQNSDIPVTQTYPGNALLSDRGQTNGHVINDEIRMNQPLQAKPEAGSRSKSSGQ